MNEVLLHCCRFSGMMPMSERGRSIGQELRRDFSRTCFMHLAKLLLTACSMLLCQAAMSQATPPSTLPAIWFSPRSAPYELSNLTPLFKPDAPWQQAASHIAVFEITGGAARNGTEGEVRAIVTGLSNRRITLGLGMSPLSGDGRCGKGVEGYNAPGQPLYDARRLQTLGGNATYLSMDEPLYYGHVFEGENACRSSVKEIANEVAAKVREVRSVYPDLKVGDIEPVGIDRATWIAEMEQWFSAYHAATGQELAFFRADIQWNRPWQHQMQALSRSLLRRGIPLQVIYNGNAHSDAEWVDQATDRFKSYESGGNAAPNVAIFQCWTANPTHVLPETDQRTLTGLVKRYVQWQQTR